MINFYFPSLIFVLVSWISFSIPPEVIPGRMALLITTLLVLVNLFGTVIQTGHSRFLTSLDIWMVACIIFVCGALFSYAFLLCQGAKKKINSSPSVKPVESINNGFRKLPEERPYNSYQKNNSVTENWDRNCLIIFPIAFLLLNLSYWPMVVMRQRPLYSLSEDKANRI